ncbi:MAG: hypothetical protein V1904_01180 [Bacteroidota bacterium]
MKKSAFIIVTVAIFLCSCGIFKYKIPYDKVVFGKGGGFTGKYDEYFIDSKGALYKKDPSSAAYTLMKSITSKQIKDVFKDIKKNNLYEVAFNNPYNYSYYIELYKGDKSNRIVWGNANNPPPAEVTGVFQKLLRLTASSDIKNNKENNSNK